jgi:glutamate--cysteine ligase
MTQTFMARIQALDSLDWVTCLQGIKRGFEKESLRVTKKGNLAKTKHPTALGSSLMHPFITTDYSEALLEFITPPLSDLNKLFDVLYELHHYTYHVLKKEMLWTASMPCLLPKEEEIAIAQYGHSNLGKLKHIYRQGLGYRYGRAMQMIAGIHYNFSLPDTFWGKYQILLNSQLSAKEFRSEQYLAISRNVLRFGWLLPLLMGASPAISASFVKQQNSTLKKWQANTLIGPFATSLRLSDLGYHNKIQSQFSISYNSFSEFLHSMKKMLHTAVPEYKHIGVQKNGKYLQLNDKMLQLEDEHYAMVRPKRVSAPDERMLLAILREGIEYLEVRAIDINPFFPMGIEKEMVYFLDAVLITCLLMDSPPITDAEHRRIAYNYTRVVKEGLNPKLTLLDETGIPRLLRDLGMELLAVIEMVAERLNKAYLSTIFTKACELVRERILSPEMLPSARVLQEMTSKKESYLEFAWRWSLQHQHYFDNKGIDPIQLDFYQKMAQMSIQEQERREHEDTIPFADYLQNYLAL